MSLGSVIGGIGGAVVGFIIGGWTGAVIGAAIGAGIGFAVDPYYPDSSSPGQPQTGELIATSSEGVTVADLVGTSKLTGNIWGPWREHVEEVTEKQDTGGKGGGGSSKEVVTGYECFATWAMGLCLAPADALYTVYKNDDIVWDGEIYRPVDGQPTTIVLEDMGSMTIYWGTDEQEAPPGLDNRVQGGADYNIPHRHLCWVFFDDCSIGDYNRIPTMKFILGKYPTYDFSPHHMIGNYDYNPAHLLYHIYTTLGDFETNLFDEASWARAAEIFHQEGLGLSCLFDRATEVKQWRDQILTHSDSVINPGTDGKYYLIPLRKDTDRWDLPLIDESYMTDMMEVRRGSWFNTINDQKVIFPERIYRDFPDETNCPNPTLTKESSSGTVLVERRLRNVNGVSLFIQPLGLSSADVVGGKAYVDDTFQTIAAYLPGTEFDTIQINTVDAAFQNDKNIVIETNIAYSGIDDEKSTAIWRVTGSYGPFDLYLRSDTNASWLYVKTVGEGVFSWIDYYDACEDYEASAVNVCKARSCAYDGGPACVSVDNYCSCGSASMVVADTTLNCGDSTTITVTKPNDNCNYDVTVNFGYLEKLTSTPTQETWRLTIFTPPGWDGQGDCCVPDNTLVQLWCCGEQKDSQSIIVGVDCDVSSIGYTSLDMLEGTTQNLTLVLPETGAEYRWELVNEESGKVGTLTPLGSTPEDGVQFEAPDYVDFAGCNQASQIILFCCEGICDQITIGYHKADAPDNVAAYVIKQPNNCQNQKYCVTPGDCWYWTRCDALFEYYNCKGINYCDHQSFISYGDAYNLCDECDFYNWDQEFSDFTCKKFASGYNPPYSNMIRGFEPWVPYDLRTNNMKQLGCCPGALG